MVYSKERCVMKQMTFGFVAVLFCLGCAGNQHSQPVLKSGMVAPAFQVEANDGKRLELGALVEAGPVVLTFLRSFF